MSSLDTEAARLRDGQARPWGPPAVPAGRRGRSSALLIIILAGIGVLIFLGLLAAPRLDEHVGFFTGRALKAVQSYNVEGVPLRGLVEKRFHSARWRAYHQDIPFQTFVECLGTPRSEGPERLMQWYVEERPAWHRGPSLKITSMTAFNGNALDLTPHLFDPRVGYLLPYWHSRQGEPR